jgi:hypothetical protein
MVMGKFVILISATLMEGHSVDGIVCDPAAEEAAMIPRSHVLIAHRLSVYAESLAAVLAALRPDLDVRQIQPSDLEEATGTSDHVIVVTDELTALIKEHADGWLLYYPDQTDVAVVGGASVSLRIEHPSLPEVLAALDQLVGSPVLSAASPEVSETA